MKKLIVIAFFSILALSSNAEVYRVGVVPQFEAQRISLIWQPILNLLNAETGHEFRLEQSDSIPEFEKAFLRGDFDIAYMNPWHAVMAYESQQYRPILRDQSRKLRGILVVKKDGPIRSLEQLNGKSIAFPAPNALGASLLMRAELTREHGVNFTPRYVGTHSSAYLNVALGSAAAGGGVMRTLDEQSLALRNRLRILYQTQPVNPHPLVVHPRVPEELVNSLLRVFLTGSAAEKLATLLEQVPIRDAVESSIDDYLRLQDLGLRDFYVN
ncbi:phosphate/phosphite/phosphonate ABC transporter substrate-binding protein [Spongiibacter marinus]|uniref:phosphate/phosphite/phosphonate ABC transporter substrate-binding protein n=1 Tax=Spongiibacter marinus TaxID=354246 RepID=UPI0035664868